MVIALQSSTGNPPGPAFRRVHPEVVRLAREQARRATAVVESLTPEQLQALIEVGPYLDTILRDVRGGLR